MANESLTVTDNRTGKTYEFAVKNGTISAMELRQIKTSEQDFGLMSYDPSYMNTASTESRITFIDGAKGILRYRGYPIEQLAEKSSFLEVSYLLQQGELPSRRQLDEFTHNITYHTMVHENIRELVDAFRYDAHPMGILLSTVGALSTFYPDARDIESEETRRLQAYRLMAKMPTIAAYAYRHRRGLPYIYPDNDLSYAGNFLNMLFCMTERRYKPNPVVEKALDVLFILHADHEQNCSASAMRAVGSSHVDPFSSLAAATAALYGPLHGGANEAVIRMLNEIGSKAKIPEFIERAKKGEVRLMGFGHRVYKNYDPRAAIIRDTTLNVLSHLGMENSPLMATALELERIALSDEYFIKKKLYPNVDFYSGILLRAMGFPSRMFTAVFAVARTVGWVSHWLELKQEGHGIDRPRQLYTGPTPRQLER